MVRSKVDIIKIARWFITVVFCIVLLMVGYMAGYFVKGTAGVLSMNELMIHENRDSSPSNKDVVGSLVCARATLQRDLYSFTILDKEEAIAEYEHCKKSFSISEESYLERRYFRERRIKEGLKDY